MSQGSGGQKRAGGPSSVQKSGPECTRGVLNGLHYQEMPLEKQEEIWTGCEKTRECLSGPGASRELEGTILCKRGVQSALEGC